VIAGLDSATEPTAAQADAAKAAGVRLWSGYIATQPNVGLYHPWPRAAFENARRCGSIPIAYCSGWDDPGALKILAATWNVRLCLDVEGGIRGDGSWAQNWLDASGAGVYGNAPVHRLRAAFHVLAAYPGGDPQATWASYLARPAGLCGWQFQGTHSEFGVGVDRCWFDDGFAGLSGGGVDTVTTDDLNLAHDALQFMVWGIVDTSAQSRNDFVFAVNHGQSLASIVDGWKQNAQAAKWQAQLATLGQAAGGPTNIQPILDELAADKTTDAAILSSLGALTAVVTKIENALKAA
jgi:hypothetical protein